MFSRKERIAQVLKKLSAQFLERESDSVSLITVTDCSVSTDLKRATIFISVLPENQEIKALMFVKRKLGKMRKYFKQNLSVKNIPFLDAHIDQGEKNRQRIERLLRQ